MGVDVDARGGIEVRVGMGVGVIDHCGVIVGTIVCMWITTVASRSGASVTTWSWMASLMISTATAGTTKAMASAE